MTRKLLSLLCRQLQAGYNNTASLQCSPTSYIRSARYDISNVITRINITQAGVCHVVATQQTRNDSAPFTHEKLRTRTDANPILLVISARNSVFR